MKEIDDWIESKTSRMVYTIGLNDFDKDGTFTWESGTASSLDVSPESSLWNERSKDDKENYDYCGTVFVYRSQFYYTVDSHNMGDNCSWQHSFVCERRGKDCTKAGYTAETAGAGAAGKKKKGKGKGKGNKGGRRRRGGFFKRAWKW